VLHPGTIPKPGRVLHSAKPVLPEVQNAFCPPGHTIVLPLHVGVVWQYKGRKLCKVKKFINKIMIITFLYMFP